MNEAQALCTRIGIMVKIEVVAILFLESFDPDGNVMLTNYFLPDWAVVYIVRLEAG